MPPCQDIKRQDTTQIKNLYKNNDLVKKIITVPETGKSKWLINLTSKQIPAEVLELASLGKNFGLPHKNRQIPLERLMTTLELSILDLPREDEFAVRAAYLNVINNYLQQPETPIELLRKIRTTSKFVKQNPDIIFLKADKGNVTVIVSRDLYISKMMNILSDPYTYCPIKYDPTKHLQWRVNKLVKTWWEMEFIPGRIRRHLHSKSRTIARAYGLPKIHKKDVPFRIIVSFVNTPTYNLAKYLQDILKTALKHPSPGLDALEKKNLRKVKFKAVNSLELKKILTSADLPKDYLMISMDVVSLFTNVPLDLVKQGIRKRWNVIKRYTDIDLESFIEATELCFTSSAFLFNKCFYQQIFGAAMGSPLSSVAADIVMENLEDECLCKLAPDIFFYLRYVDDILTFLPKNKVESALRTFNSYHNRLRFTVECEVNSRINFLELTLIRTDTGRIEFDWYRKPTASGRYLNYESHHPLMQKVSVIRGLIDKAVLLAEDKFHLKNLAFVRQSLLNNNYPIKLIKDVINRRVAQLRFRSRNLEAKEIDNVAVVEKGNFVKVEKKSVCLPYVKYLSESLKIAMCKFNICLSFKNSYNLSWLFRGHKDSLPVYEKSCVIYAVPCSECDYMFVGHTKYKLKTALKKHWHDLNYPITIVDDALTEHAFGCQHYFDLKGTKILDSEPISWVRDYLAEFYRVRLNNYYCYESYDLK